MRAPRPRRLCQEPSCRRYADKRGLCHMHYMRWRRTYSSGVPCRIEHCHRSVYGQGYCHMHWQRLYRRGDAHWEPKSYIQRFDLETERPIELRNVHAQGTATVETMAHWEAQAARWLREWEPDDEYREVMARWLAGPEPVWEYERSGRRMRQVE